MSVSSAIILLICLHSLFTSLLLTVLSAFCVEIAKGAAQLNRGVVFGGLRNIF